MKFLPIALLSLFVASCASDQRSNKDGIQREEDKQMQEEEINRTGASDNFGPGFSQGPTPPSPYTFD